MTASPPRPVQNQGEEVRLAGEQASDEDRRPQELVVKPGLILPSCC
ncbi:MAG: hypothetical protein M3R02_10905 [Chloroflexota bacterium]|nr:hypothetical protein [Chloroflexota bacterium]